MPANAMPALDVPSTAGWKEQDRTLYNNYSYYFAKVQTERRKIHPRWKKLVGKRKWTPNMGETMRMIRKVASPHIRQFAHPQLLKDDPRKDIIDVREVTKDVNVYRHQFESMVLDFFPYFNDFMAAVDDNLVDITEKIDRFEDVYIRGNIFHMAPRIGVCIGDTIRILTAPWWSGIGTFATATDGKNAGWIQSVIGDNPTMSHLTLTALNHAATVLDNDLRVPFYSGSDLPKEDAPLDGKYALVVSSEAYNQFTFDPYLQANKNCQLDVVHNRFRGSIFGFITSLIEDIPLRHDGSAVFHPPELRVGTDSGAYNPQDTEPNPTFALPENSPYEWAFLSGAKGFESVDVGPPPSAFTGDSPPHNFPKMQWNAEVYLTKNFLIERWDATNSVIRYETNSYGHKVKFQSEGTFGVAPVNQRNVLPILFKRKRGV